MEECMEQLICENISKNYKSKDALQDVSLTLEKGKIYGLIGRNGAGKTTLIKSMLNLVHPTSGSVRIFGMELTKHETEIKQRIGYASGSVGYYRRKKLKDIAKVTRTFYRNWDDGLYRTYLSRFSLDENKTPDQLSEGMKVKFNLALALSHRAELLILDEPTSGLDPVSRDELLEIFNDLCAEGSAILFSTHITEDLDKCADNIAYIRSGRLAAFDSREGFEDSYRLVALTGDESVAQFAHSLGISRGKKENTMLIRREDESLFVPEQVSVPDLGTVMVHLEKEDVK